MVADDHSFSSLRLRQNRRHFTDNSFKCIFLNDNEWILLRISLKFVPRVQIDNIPALVQIMAWRRLGDKPLSEPMTVSLLTHICVTQPQWVKVWHHLHIGLVKHWSELSCYWWFPQNNKLRGNWEILTTNSSCKTQMRPALTRTGNQWRGLPSHQSGCGGT